MDEKKKENFINSWGEMGSLWGLNNSIARVHALLIVTEDPVSLDDISSRLNISRGNASMCLKELRNWGVIRRVKVSGDRKDYYTSEPDVWKMFFSIARERKRRELNPVLESVRDIFRDIGKNNMEGKVGDRLIQMEQLLSTLDKISENFLANEDQAKFILSTLSGKKIK